MPLERTPTESGAILYEPSRIDHPAAEDFNAGQLARAGRIERRGGGRGSVLFVRAPGGAAHWVLRHYQRGGLIARLTADRYLWRGEEATRPFRELRLLAELERQGLPAARPVAAHYLRGVLNYRADLMTLAIADAQPLSALLAGGVPPATWRSIGATIRRFHDAGVFHADLNAHNVLVRAGAEVWLLDFDRGELRAPGSWCAANLARLQRSLRKLAAAGAARFTPEDWAALADGYGPPRNAPRR
jgi:3-deoxy-D-manno-octulosonic acid kinase